MDRDPISEGEICSVLFPRRRHARLAASASLLDATEFPMRGERHLISVLKKLRNSDFAHCTNRRWEF